MSFLTVCEHCGAVMRVQDERDGETVSCPKCGKKLLAETPDRKARRLKVEPDKDKRKEYAEKGKAAAFAYSAPRTEKRWILGIGAILAVLIIGCAFALIDLEKQRDETPEIYHAGTRSQEAKKLSNLKLELAYLAEIEEVKWVEFGGVYNNDVFIGFNPIPNDWNAVIRSAALHGNKAVGFGVHAWAFDASRPGRRPGDSNLIGNVTARYGRIE